MMMKLRDVLARIKDAPDQKSKMAEAKQFWSKGLKNLLVIQYHPNFKFNLPEGVPPFTTKSNDITLEQFFKLAETFVFANNKVKIQNAFIKYISSMEVADAEIAIAVKDRNYDLGFTLESLKVLDGEIWNKVEALAGETTEKVEVNPEPVKVEPPKVEEPAETETPKVEAEKPKPKNKRAELAAKVMKKGA